MVEGFHSISGATNSRPAAASRRFHSLEPSPHDLHVLLRHRLLRKLLRYRPHSSSLHWGPFEGASCGAGARLATIRVGPKRLVSDRGGCDTRTARASQVRTPGGKERWSSPTAMTISRMALRVSTEPEGPPVPMAYFLSVRRWPPPGWVRPLLRVGRGRLVSTSSERSSRTQGYGGRPRRAGRSPSPMSRRDQAITEAIEAGVKEVRDVQGHANAGITLGRYDHLLPGSEAEAAELFDACLDGAARGRRGARSLPQLRLQPRPPVLKTHWFRPLR